MGPAHLANVAHLACRTALSRRGVAHLTIPVDTQTASTRADTASERNVPHHAGTTWATICFLSYATIVAFLRVLRGGQAATWDRAAIGEPA
jgi:thiamine pyrophosphate-dependent acetolactate synthase large subunit-like protein